MMTINQDPTLIEVFIKRTLTFFRRYRCRNDLHQFALVYFPQLFYKKLSLFHLELFRDLSSVGKNKRLVRIAPRGHGKTTILVTTYVLWNLAFAKKQFCLIFASNQELAESKIQTITEELEHNETLMDDFPHLIPKKDGKKQFVSYTDSKIIFSNDSILMGKGIGGAIRGINLLGKRPDLIIIDDPEKDRDVLSMKQRERNKRFFDSVVKFIGSIGTPMDILCMDTLKHYDSLIHYIFQKQGWDKKRYSAVLSHDRKEVLWQSVYCYHVDQLTDFEKENWEHRGGKGFEDIRIPFYGVWFAPNEPNEPKIVGMAEGSTDEALFFRQEFLSEPIQLDQMPLRKAFWRFFDYHEAMVSEASIPPNSDIPLLPYRIGALDLSLGKTSGDWQAIAIVGFRKNHFYLLDAALVKYDLVPNQEAYASEDPTESLSALCCRLAATHKIQAFIIEDNGAQGLFINSLRALFLKEGIGCRVLGRRSEGDKVARINGMLGMLMQSGTFLIRRDWQSAYREFMKQFELFPKGDHDDAPDVANLACQHLAKAVVAHQHR